VSTSKANRINKLPGSAPNPVGSTAIRTLKWFVTGIALPLVGLADTPWWCTVADRNLRASELQRRDQIFVRPKIGIYNG